MSTQQNVISGKSHTSKHVFFFFLLSFFFTDVLYPIFHAVALYPS